jgi:hypothetical protein
MVRVFVRNADIPNQIQGSLSRSIPNEAGVVARALMRSLRKRAYRLPTRTPLPID